MNTEDVENLGHFEEMFSEFQTKSDVFGGEQYSTMSLVLPMIKDLYFHLTKFFDSLKLQHVAHQISGKMEHYLGHITDSNNKKFQPLFTVATFLSSTYHLSLEESEKKLAVDFLVKEVARIQMLRLPAEEDPLPKRLRLPGLRYLEVRQQLDDNQNRVGVDR